MQYSCHYDSTASIAHTSSTVVGKRMSWAGLDRRTVSAVIVIVDAGALYSGVCRAQAWCVVLTACAAETAACFLGYFAEKKTKNQRKGEHHTQMLGTLSYLSPLAFRGALCTEHII